MDAPDDKALTLQEVATRLGLAYSTVFAKRHQIGFRLPGSRVWRVWPARLAELSAPRNTVARLSLRAVEETPCQSAKIKRPVSTKSPSARRAVERELDALLARPTARPRRNTTTG